MAGTFNYDRPKSSSTNSTGMSITIEAAESPTAEAAVASGSTGVLTATFLCDADESGGADIQDLGKFTITPVLNATTGKIQFTVQFTPVNGDATDGAAQTHTFDHPQVMDSWQTDAGRARQA